jgi:hypothetical protein
MISLGNVGLSQSSLHSKYLVSNQPTECIRDLDPDMEKECKSNGHVGEMKEHTRWCYSMSGREFGRVYSWGSGPRSVSVLIVMV